MRTSLANANIVEGALGTNRGLDHARPTEEQAKLGIVRYAYASAAAYDFPTMKYLAQDQTLMHSDRGRIVLLVFARRFMQDGDIEEMQHALEGANVWDSLYAAQFVLDGAQNAELRGRQKLADGLFHAASSIYVGNVEFHRELASLLYNRGLVDDSLAQYEEVVRLAPQSFGDQMRLAEVMFEAGRLDEARASSQRAASLRPENARPLAVLAQIAIRQGQSQEAISLLLKAVEGYSPDSFSLLLLASVYKSQGRLDDAVVFVKRGLAQDPKAAWGYGLMGEILSAQGQRQEAVGQFKQAATLAVGKRDEIIYTVQLAELYMQMGELDQAITTYKRALQLDRWQVKTDYIRAQLGRLGQSDQ